MIKSATKMPVQRLILEMIKLMGGITSLLIQ